MKKLIQSLQQLTDREELNKANKERVHAAIRSLKPKNNKK